MNKHHQIENVHIKEGMLHLVANGNSIQYQLRDVSPLLAAATEKERNEFEVSPSGYGIHWPLIDEDISINGLLCSVNIDGNNR